MINPLKGIELVKVYLQNNITCHAKESSAHAYQPF